LSGKTRKKGSDSEALSENPQNHLIQKTKNSRKQEEFRFQAMTRFD
jgi:hypothetical protein